MEISSEETELMLASILGPRDAAGEHARTVVLRVTDRGDLTWVEPAIGWLAERGRRVVLRTQIRLPRSVVARAQAHDALVMLEVISTDPAVQRALVGPGAESMSSLLLHAQYLRTAGVQVATWVGPVMPTIHDRPANIDPLWRHVAAAQITDAHISPGRLGPKRFAGLKEALGTAKATAVARAFSVPLDEELVPVIDPDGARLDSRVATELLHAVGRSADEAGIRVDGCGCPLLCHKRDPRRDAHPYVELTTADLFGSLVGSLVGRAV